MKKVEKRSAVLYVRVKPSTKLYVKKLAKKVGVSESEVVCMLIQTEKDARHKD